MQTYQREIMQIQQILEDNPKGMTVTDISRKIKINRNSVAKYLDIMRISGLVEMITFGPAKVFFPSRRVPISNMLNFISDYILVLDRDLKVVQINDAFLDFMKIGREEVIGQYAKNTNLPMFNENIDISSDVKAALDGKHFTRDIAFQRDEEEVYCRVRVFPTMFKDGQNAAALVIKNTTDQKMAEKALRDSEERFRSLLGNIDENKK